ncbi:MAG: betaine/proline/choline family ABC transporter ATP-binding protein [Paracoccaceae bacterium]
MKFVVSVQDVWKIFGVRQNEALAAIKAEGLSKSEVLKRFDCVVGVSGATFDIPVGEIFCVMGLSGSGKSTLVRHVNRLLEPTTGRILINGQDVMSLDETQLRKLRARHIGMVFQNIALLPHRTVRENVALPLEVQDVSRSKRFEIAEDVLRRVNLSGWEDKYPHELSGGMQQRVGLARAMAADPDILLMDEPFSALDPLIRRQLQDQFLELSAAMRKTTIFITHDLDEAIRIGHRIAIMKDGAIVQIGTPEEIVTNPADEYVEDFVAGISKLNLIYARTIMEPFDTAECPDLDRVTCPKALESHNLNQLIDLAAGARQPLLIQSDTGQITGIISKDRLLRAIQRGK